MGGLITLLIGIIAITFLPSFVFGLIFKAWRPFLMSFGILLFFIWAHPSVKFNVIGSPIHYFTILALYVAGGKLRTGKSEKELMSGAASE